MISKAMTFIILLSVIPTSLPQFTFAQQPPYDVFPAADPPYYRVRYDASAKPGELIFPVNYTLWVPAGVKTLRGVIVHQHGCGEGSCKSGLTGAYDLHWQALAKKHGCALLAPAYEQPKDADCQMWCDPRNGSAAAFQKCLVDLGAKSGHPELPKVPWALWGHSGGGHWAGGMALLFPDRVAAAWLRSGVPLLNADPKRTAIKPHTLPEAALKVPMMCNLGTKEGVTVKDGRFAGVWPANEAFFGELRSQGGLIGVAIDPLTAHECGNQRYLAIPWLDACFSARLPKSGGHSLEKMPTDRGWLAQVTGTEVIPAESFTGDPLKATWLPNEVIARAWGQYVKDTVVKDTTPPPAPTNVRVTGNELTWEAEADLESGLAFFLIERDGQFLAKVPGEGENPFGRALFQNLQYSDTPTQPLVQMRYTDEHAESGKTHSYRVIAVNTVGLKSEATGELPRVVLIGDSIRLSYAATVIKQLNGKAVVISPKANGGDSSNVLKNLDQWAIREQPAIVHFNCGIHDTKKFIATGKFQVSPEQYEANLRKIVQKIREKTDAVVLFATTTPTLDDRAAKARQDRDYKLLGANIKQYNSIAERVMRELKVPTNDLFKAVSHPEAPLTTETLIGPDGVHLTPAGQELLGKQVAKFIHQELMQLAQ